MNDFPKAADVLVIGGGMLGAAAAYYLAKAGMSVVLCERGNICSEATGRQGGMVTQIDGRDLNVDLNVTKLKYARANNRIYDILQDELQFDFQYRRRGGLDIAFEDEEFEHLKRLYKIQKESGDDEIMLLDNKELRELCPTISSDAKGARYRPSDGNINTFLLTYGLIGGAKCYGAKIFSNTPVRRVLFNGNNEVIGAETARRNICTPWVFNACGAWAEELTPELDIAPVCSTAAISEPIPPIHIQTFEAELKGKVVYGSTQTARGNLLFGASLLSPRSKKEHLNHNLSLAEVRFTASVISQIFPMLNKVNVMRVWSGTMGWSADGLPYVGEVPGKKGLVVAAAFPNGCAYGLICAKLAAECIYNGKPSMPLDIFDVGRFKKRLKWPDAYDYSILGNFLAQINSIEGEPGINDAC
jgi:sarcosine oxidase subunit beta